MSANRLAPPVFVGMGRKSFTVEIGSATRFLGWCGHCLLHYLFMNRETLIAELERLLDVGEPLLTVFPAKWPGSWLLELPDNISDEMRFYAHDVSYRTQDRERYQDFCQQNTTDELAAWVKYLEVGLLGWRAIGVLK